MVHFITFGLLKFGAVKKCKKFAVYFLCWYLHLFLCDCVSSTMLPVCRAKKAPWTVDGVSRIRPTRSIELTDAYVEEEEQGVPTTVVGARTAAPSRDEEIEEL